MRSKLSILLLLLLHASSIHLCVSLASRQDLKKQKPLRQRKDTLSVERHLQHIRGYRYVIGSDDSGRGCIAGPVVTASCCIVGDLQDENAVIIPEVDDSKLLSRESRNRIYETILSRPKSFVWAVASRSNQDIDATSMDQATQECFQETIESVINQLQELDGKNMPPLEDDNIMRFYSIIDGHKSPKISISSRPWKGGDEMVYSVALASILARVTHEYIMENTSIPLYGFEDNHGYPTRSHIQALHQHGPSAIHRKSCKPVQGR